MAGKVSSDLLDAIKERPQLFGGLDQRIKITARACNIAHSPRGARW